VGGRDLPTSYETSCKASLFLAPIANMREDLLVESLARESKITEILATLIIRHKRAKEGGDDHDEVPANKRKT
jgi:hypothetical protein